MLSLSLSSVAMWTKGNLRGADIAVRGVFTDTRAPKSGAMFVALKGENFDAHEFVAQAQQSGAVAALVARPVDVAIPQVIVDDTMIALGDLASAVRAQRRARVIGITGSNGKTTVKTLLASILTLHGKTHVNAGNLNNEIGLPLSIFDMPEDTEFAVLEMGAGKPGDIAYLAAIARPEIGLVNNIAPAHLERMGTLEGIAETKGALYTSLPAQGVAVINADDAFADCVLRHARRQRAASIRFGLDAKSPTSARTTSTSSVRRRSSRWCIGDDRIDYRAAARRSSQRAQNALAAAACALCARRADRAIKRQGTRSGAIGVKGRLQRYAMAGGWTLIDDSYNANPGSTAAGIATLACRRPAKRGWCSATCANSAHARQRCTRKSGELATTQRHRAYCTRSRRTFRAAAAKAFGATAKHFDNDQTALSAALEHRECARRAFVLLVKGSRGSAMERIVGTLLRRRRCADASERRRCATCCLNSPNCCAAN